MTPDDLIQLIADAKADPQNIVRALLDDEVRFAQVLALRNTNPRLWGKLLAELKAAGAASIQTLTQAVSQAVAKDAAAAAGPTVEDILRQKLEAGEDIDPALLKDLLGTKTSAASEVVAAVLEADVFFFHTADDEPYAAFQYNGHREVWPVVSRGFKRYVRRLHYENTGAALNASQLADAIGLLEAEAVFSGEQGEVFTRLAEVDGTIYLDLADEAWRVVAITSIGWSTLDTAPVFFRRAPGMLALPEPVTGGKFNELRRFVNVSDDDWPLLAGFVVQMARPRGPYPVLVERGEQGSGKSTVAKAIRSLVDPNRAPNRSEPREERDLVIAARNGWVVSLSNLSRIQPWLSDALCRLVFGEGFGTRQLYSDADEQLFDAARPVIVNGITEVATRADLLDRSVLVNLPSIPDDERREEEEFWGEFDEAHPRLLGALCDALAMAMRRRLLVTLERKPRMADFARWATAAEPALGLDDGAFMAAYVKNRGEANDMAIESEIISEPLLALIPKPADEWMGTARQLLDCLTEVAAGDKLAEARTAEEKAAVLDRVRRQDGWPKNPRALAGILDRLKPNLRAAGVDFERLPRKGRSRPLRIRNEGAGPSQPSRPSSDEQNRRSEAQNESDGRGDDGDGRGDDPPRPSHQQPRPSHHETAGQGPDGDGRDDDDGRAPTTESEAEVCDACGSADVYIHEHGTGRPLCQPYVATVAAAATNGHRTLGILPGWGTGPVAACIVCDEGTASRDPEGRPCHTRHATEPEVDITDQYAELDPSLFDEP